MVARSGVRFTADDIWETPDDGNRYEVLDGDLVVTPPPVWDHQRAVSKLLWYLAQHVYEHDLGEVVPAPVGVILDEGSGVQPDIVFIARERLHIVGPRGVQGAPDLAVEVLSPGTQSRDRGIKMKRYALGGISHYWIVDPRSHTLEAYLLTEARYEIVGTYGNGATFQPALFPGLEIPIDGIFS